MTPNPNPSPELKPCPFCASTALEVRHNENLSGMETVDCRNCGARGPHVETARQATDGWSTRTLSPQTLPAPGEVERVLVPRIATRAMVDAADACSDPYSAWNAMVEASNAR